MAVVRRSHQETIELSIGNIKIEDEAAFLDFGFYFEQSQVKRFRSESHPDSGLSHCPEPPTP